MKVSVFLTLALGASLVALIGCGSEGSPNCVSDADCSPGLCLEGAASSAFGATSCVATCSEVLAEDLHEQDVVCVSDAPQRCDDVPLDTLEQCQVCGCAAGEACTDAGCVGCDTVTAEVSDLNCGTCGCETDEECRGERLEAVCFRLALEGEACTRHADCAEDNCSSPHMGPRVCLKAPGTACTSNSDCDLCIAGECQQACGPDDNFCGAGMACSSSGEGFFCRVECENEGEPCPGVVGTICESRFTSGGMENFRCFGADCTMAGFECPTGYACVETVTGQFLGDRCMPD